MGTDTLSVSLTKTEDPLATPYGVATDNNRSAAVFNGVFQEKWNTLEYLLKRAADLFGTPILISGVSAALDKITTATAHGLSAGTLIRFKALNGGTLPGGLDTAGFSGYLLADTATTFQVSLTSGGAAIDITTAGSGNLYVYAVPDVLAELISSSGSGVMGSLKALFVTLGGAQTIPGAKVVDDLTLSGTSYVKMASRSISRSVPCTFVDISTALAYRMPCAIPATKTVGAVIDLPHGATLTGMTVRIDPTNVGVLPGTMPKVTVLRLDTAGGSTDIGNQTDTSADFTIFSAGHDIAVSGMTEVIDKELYTYRVDVRGSSDDVVTVLRVKPTVTVTGMRDWA